MRLSLPLLAALLLPACTQAVPVSGSTPTDPLVTQPCVHLPVGPPDGEGYRVAQGFTENNHLGEDWNGVGGGNTDKGDPVYAMADGTVTFADEGGPGWGPVVTVAHRFAEADGVRGYESLYAHLDRIDVTVGQPIGRGQQLGTIGDAHGRYVSHLHLEVRDGVGLPIGPGYRRDTSGYIDPRQWAARHRDGCGKRPHLAPD